MDMVSNFQVKHFELNCSSDIIYFHIGGLKKVIKKCHVLFEWPLNLKLSYFFQRWRFAWKNGRTQMRQISSRLNVLSTQYWYGKNRLKHNLSYCLRHNL